MMSFSEIKGVKTGNIRAEQIPPFCKFSDKTLIEMSNRMPIILEDFLDINGVGDVKASKIRNVYGLYREYSHEYAKRNPEHTTKRYLRKMLSTVRYREVLMCELRCVR